MGALGVDTGILAILAVAAAIILAVSAAVLLARGAEDKDLSVRVQGILRPEVVQEQVVRRRGSAAAAPFRKLGEIVRDRALVSPKDLEEIQMAAAAAGLNPRAAVPTFLGIKAVLLVALPLTGFLYGYLNGFTAYRIGVSTFLGIVAGIWVPNFVFGYMKSKHEQHLRKGLPDALDLLVVTAEAGLGIETALDRVAREMEHTNRPIAIAFLVLVQELRMLPDRRVALERFGQRTSFEGFRRLGGTLAQTLKYGTPLAQALRVLASEMRTDRMLRIEEKAIRLPALLVIPLILFIMPAVFIALVGPSVLELSKGIFAGVRR